MQTKYYKEMVFPIKIFEPDKITIIQDESEFKDFASSYLLLYAAGGIVQNEIQDVLMIYRRGFWDFPKGKVEEYESVEEAAKREVKEETGLKYVKTEKMLAHTFHTYKENGQPILKQTCWFRMFSSGNQLLVPEIGEGIDHIEWVKKDEVSHLLENSYASLLDLWERVIGTFSTNYTNFTNYFSI